MGALRELMEREEHVLVAVRHGQTAWNLEDRLTTTSDIPLTALGEEQARRVGQALAGLRFDHALASPLQRAWRTGQLALADADVRGELRADERLIEPGAGPFEGEVFSQLRSAEHPLSRAFAAYQDEIAPSFPSGAEPLEETVTKVSSLLEEIAATPGHWFLSSHGALLRILTQVFCGGDPACYRRLKLDNGHLVACRFFPGPPHQLVHFNLPPGAAA